MPQCIEQQDQSSWLAAMKACTTKRCTSHFGVICTRHQWLTELNCLSTEFSPELLQAYLPYCDRSILGKAQLYEWIRSITSRTWLIDIGDANELQNLSPTSLTEGYADLDVINHAPTCLADSVSAQSRESYQHVIASCMFTGSTQYIGRAARPWEYSESLRSMVALGLRLSFDIDPENEPCSGSTGIELTKERLWINATCGSTILPDNWTNTLETTTNFAYIPIEDWHWPRCVADMPKQVTELPDRCVADACEVDSASYCSKVKPAVDRACFCHNISYDSCGGSCQIFETRINYINWLHGICGQVQDWQGLPDNWRQLAAPTAVEMIPWRWAVKPYYASNSLSVTTMPLETCYSNEWKLGSFALVNIITFLAIILSQRKGIHRILWHHRRPWSWYSRGALIAIFQIIANYINALLVHGTPGYEDVPITQLMLLWCSMPRLACLTILLLVGIQQQQSFFKAMDLSVAASFLFAEAILQTFSLYYMFMTVEYGLVEHNFYFRNDMERAERGGAAQMMYTGALIWLTVIIALALVPLLPAICRMMNRINDPPKTRRYKRYTSSIENQVHFRTYNGRNSEESRLIRSSSRRDELVYGTFAGATKDQDPLFRASSRERTTTSSSSSSRLYTAMIIIISMSVLWLAQWLFWGGFIALSSEEFCPPRLVMLTAIWVNFSLAGVIVGVP